MKKLFMIVLFVFFIPSPSVAADKWTKQNIIMEGMYQLLHFIDWSQTRYIAKSPSSSRRIIDFVDWEKKKYVFKYPKPFSEMNPVIGRHPSVSRVDQYFLITTFLHLAISHYLPENYRVAWQGMTIFVSGGMVGHNYSVGIKLDL